LGVGLDPETFQVEVGQRRLRLRQSLRGRQLVPLGRTPVAPWLAEAALNQVAKHVLSARVAVGGRPIPRLACRDELSGAVRSQAVLVGRADGPSATRHEKQL